MRIQGTKTTTRFQNKGNSLRWVFQIIWRNRI